MSTPINPNTPDPRQQQGGPSGQPMAQQPPMPQMQGQPMGQGHPMPQGRPGFVPGQAPASTLDSGAPTQARLPQPLGDDGRSTPIGFGRLVTVELRKMVDTRAGKWLLGSAFALMLLISVGISFTHEMKTDPQFGNYLSTAIIALKFILPVVGTMAVTSEWSQRTGLVTFALEPRRARVGLAKWLAALILGFLVITFTLLIAAVMTAIMSAVSGTHGDVWNFGAGRIAAFYFIFLLFVSMGVAFGLLIQNTPAAICAFLFVPIIFSIVTGFEATRSIGEWADPNQNLFSLLNDNPGDKLDNQWAKIAVGQLLWLVLPMVLGFMRLTKREVKSS